MYPDNPMMGMGWFDHQSYELSGGVWIIRDATELTWVQNLVFTNLYSTLEKL